MSSDSNKAELKSCNSGHNVTISANHGDIEAQKHNGTVLEPSPAQSRKEEEVKDSKDDFLIGYEGSDDPLDPQNIAEWKKWSFAVILGLITPSTTFASTIFSTATESAANESGVSNEVMTLGTAFFIAGTINPMPLPPGLPLVS